MRRITLTADEYDIETGIAPTRWFDMDKAIVFDDKETWDGNNMVSTAGRFQHERLFRTAGGKWILERTSNWRGSLDQYTEINNSEAASWLVRNDHDEHESCVAEYAALEVK